MTIFELAQELGKALKEDEKLVRLANAKKAYENDNVIKKYMVEYEGEKLLLDTSSKIYKKKYSEYFAEKMQNRENFCYKTSCKFINFSSDMSFIGDLKIL